MADEVLAEIKVDDSVEFLYTLVDHEGRLENLTDWIVEATVGDPTDPLQPPVWQGTGVLQPDELGSLFLVPGQVLDQVGDYPVTITGTKALRRHSVVGVVRTV